MKGKRKGEERSKKRQKRREKGEERENNIFLAGSKSYIEVQRKNLCAYHKVSKCCRCTLSRSFFFFSLSLPTSPSLSLPTSPSLSEQSTLTHELGIWMGEFTYTCYQRGVML
jgi:hypothetical protein